MNNSRRDLLIMTVEQENSKEFTAVFAINYAWLGWTLIIISKWLWLIFHANFVIFMAFYNR